jgi:hypothetical protein
LAWTPKAASLFNWLKFAQADRAKLKAHEAKLERWARSGDFVLAVPGESVSAVVNPDGTSWSSMLEE